MAYIILRSWQVSVFLYLGMMKFVWHFLLYIVFVILRYWHTLQFLLVHFVIGNALGRSFDRSVVTVGLGSSLCSVGCRSGSVTLAGMLILALTRKLASDLFFLYAIIGLSGSMGFN